MISSTARKPIALSEERQVSRNARLLATKKLWLPKLLYDFLPYFYLISGIVALLATLYISEWFWVLPHYLLFSAACIHLGFVVYRRRHSRKTDLSNPDLS